MHAVCELHRGPGRQLTLAADRGPPISPWRRTRDRSADFTSSAWRPVRRDPPHVRAAGRIRWSANTPTAAATTTACNNNDNAWKRARRTAQNNTKLVLRGSELLTPSISAICTSRDEHAPQPTSMWSQHRRGRNNLQKPVKYRSAEMRSITRRKCTMASYFFFFYFFYYSS